MSKISKIFIVLLLALSTLSGCSNELIVDIPESITPNTIDVNVEVKRVPLEDQFIKQFESLYNKEETPLKETIIENDVLLNENKNEDKTENITPEKEEVNKEENKQDKNDGKPTFTEVNETLYVISDVNIRKGPGTNYEKVGKLKVGESITRIGVGDNGWSKVMYNGEEAYISSNYLSKTKPEEPKVEETPKEDNKPSNVLNSKDSYSINKGFKYLAPTISNELKPYALDIIDILENCQDDNYTYSFMIDLQGRRAFDIVDEISDYIDNHYDPAKEFTQIMHNGVFRHVFLEDGTVKIFIDIKLQESRSKIAYVKTSRDFIKNAANSINLTGNKVKDLRQIHDYICKKASYDYTYDPDLNSIYSLATTGKTRCAGYSEAFEEICNYVGMNVKYVTGYGGGGLHAWNSVKIDETTYYIDVTWDDTESNYDYFLLTAEQLSKDHSW